MTLRHEVHQTLNMGYDLFLTTAYIHTTCILICSHPIPLSDIHKPRFWKQFYTKEFICSDSLFPLSRLRGNIKYAAWWVFKIFLFLSWFAHFSQTQQRAWNSPKCCAVFTALFIQDKMNATYKALENHVSEFCSTQNCQKVFVTLLWLHYTYMRYFTLT